MPVGRSEALAWIAELQRVYSVNRERLTDLDAAIGDADHGTNMDRGFTAVREQLERGIEGGVGALFKSVAMMLIKTVGGASGPLYGTFFLRAAAACGDKAELDASDIVAVFRAGVEGIVQRGKAAPGDKTMLDALSPAVSAMEVAGAASIGSLLDAAADAAERGMNDTIPIQARKGRASYLGPRSVGHQDPGATSAYLLVRAAADVWRDA